VIPRTFSLALLLLLITTVGLLCGFAVNFPPRAIVLMTALAPSIIVLLMLANAARNRTRVLVISAFGALIGMLTVLVMIGPVPADLRNWSQIWTEFLRMAYLQIVFFALIGVVLFGGAALIYDIYSRHATPEGDRLDQQREIHRLLP
jgi:hypothetical protein